MSQWVVGGGAGIKKDNTPSTFNTRAFNKSQWNPIQPPSRGAQSKRHAQRCIGINL